MPSQKDRRGIVVFHCLSCKRKNNGKDGYFAICVDLCLFTWRPTYKEARKSLEQAILLYLEGKKDCIEKGEIKNIKELRKYLYRPAPFFPYKLQYSLCKIIDMLFLIKKNDPIAYHKIFEKHYSLYDEK
jgi:predicted RNase H-like HicB family nuclease